MKVIGSLSLVVVVSLISLLVSLQSETKKSAATSLAGDSNCDGFISLADVLSIRRQVAGIPIDISSCGHLDANNDGNITAVDALTLLRVLGGLEDSQNQPAPTNTPTNTATTTKPSTPTRTPTPTKTPSRIPIPTPTATHPPECVSDFQEADILGPIDPDLPNFVRFYIDPFIPVVGCPMRAGFEIVSSYSLMGDVLISTSMEPGKFEPKYPENVATLVSGDLFHAIWEINYIATLTPQTCYIWDGVAWNTSGKTNPAYPFEGKGYGKMTVPIITDDCTSSFSTQSMIENLENQGYTVVWR